jgi:hypothetical protein
MSALLAGMRRYPDMASEQKWIFSSIVNDQAHHLESALALYESGTLKGEVYNGYLDFFSAVMATPGARLGGPS